MIKIKKRILKTLLCLSMFTFIFSLVEVNTHAYELNDNGNLVSSNLFDINNAFRIGNFNVSDNGVVSGIDSSNRFHFIFEFYNDNEQDSYDDYYYNNTGLISYVFGKDSSFNIIQFGFKGNSNDILFRYELNDDLFVNGRDYVLSFNILSYNQDISFNNIMLNEGDEVIPYEPYGVWYSSAINNGISYVFDGAQAYLYDRDTDNFVMSETIDLHSTNLFVFRTDCPNIYNYLNSYEGSSPYFYVDITLNVSINSKLVIDTYNTIIDSRFVVGNGANYSESFSREEFNSTILVTPTQYYNSVSFNGIYAPDYINFSINLDFESVAYDFGYKNGYDNGYNASTTDSFNNGKRVGYQEGYNEGINTNVESNGLKNLFNSILSYPVNLIKSVFDFEFMGINVSSLIMFIVSIGIVAFVISKFL